MLEPVFQFIEKFVTDFSWKRLALFFSFMSLLLVGLITFEWYTSSYELGKYSSSVDILKELEPLVQSKSPEVSAVAKNITLNISRIIEKKGIAESIELTFGSRTSQGILASLPWLIFFLMYLPSALKDGSENAYYSLIGFGFFGALAAGVGAIFPPDWNNWLRYGGPQVFSLALMLVLYVIGNRK